MSDEKSKDSLRVKLNQYLEENKHRKTPERYFVVDVVTETTKRFDAEYIQKEVAKNGIRISRGTVYNTLSLMVDAQILREHEIEGKKFFERAPLSQTYVRLICTQCGKVKDSKDSDLITLVNSRKFGRFSTSYSTVVIYGLCSSCVNAKRKATLKAKLIAKENKLESKKKLLSNNKKNK